VKEAFPLKILTSTILLFYLTILTTSQFAYAQPTLAITVTTNKQTYKLEENVNISGNLTLDGQPVTNGLVVIQVDYPSPHGLCTIRVLPTGPQPSPWLEIAEISKLYPSDEAGNQKDSFRKGTLAHFTIAWRNREETSHYISICVSLYDVNNFPFKTFIPTSGWIGPGESTNMTFSVPIPTDAPTGEATIYANALSGLPKNGGFAYCPEKSANFTITSSTTAMSKTQTVNPTYAEATYNLTFHLSTTGGTVGNYTIYASSMYRSIDTLLQEVTANATTTFEVMLLGDINNSGAVDIDDLLLLIDAFWSTPGEPNWNPNADINNSGAVDIDDLLILIDHFWEHV
jgi:hypothetical protein